MKKQTSLTEVQAAQLLDNLRRYTAFDFAEKKLMHNKSGSSRLDIVSGGENVVIHFSYKETRDLVSKRKKEYLKKIKALGISIEETSK